MAWDVFISHASEDKDAFVRPLAEELRRAKIRVWYDEFSVSLGDSLRESIDRGIAESRLGMVVFSRHFFRKDWPRNELNGLFSLATTQGKRLIPIWLDVTAAEVSRYSPMLADRVALRVEHGLPTMPTIVEEVYRLVVRAEPPPPAKGVHVPIPQEIVEGVRRGKCVLLLGPQVAMSSPDGARHHYAEAPETAAELSRRLAVDADYPGLDATRLDEVASFFDWVFSRRHLAKAIAEGMTGPHIAPSPLHRILAALPFPMTITTNHDHLFDDALREAQTLDGALKQPVVCVYELDRKRTREELDYEPSEQSPLLFKLFGDIDNPRSLVVTAEDHINFIQRLGDGYSPHSALSFIRYYLERWDWLFVGYDQRDIGVRLLSQSIPVAALLPKAYFVDPSPSAYLKRTLDGLIRESPWDFVPSLYREVTGREYRL
jgi:TIR domain/SIR2-like domain